MLWFNFSSCLNFFKPVHFFQTSLIFSNQFIIFLKPLMLYIVGILRWPTRDTLQTKKKRCKQKRNAANKTETLQTKKKCCKQKRNAANKKERCKQKRNTANKKEVLQTKKGTAANIKKGTLQIKRNAANKKEERCK